MESSDLFRGGRLFQQYLVDAWASIEASELYWVRNNQKTIRADLYDGLRDALRGENVDMSQMGKQVVLPASHPGSTRHMFQLFQDSMAITQHCGCQRSCREGWYRSCHCLVWHIQDNRAEERRVGKEC